MKVSKCLVLGLMAMMVVACDPGDSDGNNGGDTGADASSDVGTDTGADADVGADTTEDSGDAGSDCDNPTMLASADINGGVTLSAGCYAAEQDLFLNDGVLTLEPGVEIRFAQDEGLDIGGNGRLNAQGTADDPVVLTGMEQQRGFWAGLYYHDTLSDDNVLDHVVIEYAGGDEWTGGNNSKGGVFVRENDVKLQISNTTFRENAWVGLLIRSGGSDVTVSSSTFENNDLPMWVVANHVGSLATDNTFTGNDDSYVLIGVGNVTGITADTTWKPLDVHYRVRADMYVRDALTIAPGTTIAFEQGIGLLVKGGTLTADGSGGDRIRFIAAEGETLNGYWSGIGFTSSVSSANLISNADVMYGGNDEWIGDQNDGPGNIVLDNDSGDSATVALDDVLLSGSGGAGLQVGEGSEVITCTNVTFDDNDGGNAVGAGAFSCN